MDMNDFSPFERDFISTSSHLDEAAVFMGCVSYFEIEDLDSLSQLPQLIWSIFFPDNTEVLITYFGHYGMVFDEVEPEERARRGREAIAILEKKYKPLVRNTWKMIPSSIVDPSPTPETTSPTPSPVWSPISVSTLFLLNTLTKWICILKMIHH